MINNIQLMKILRIISLLFAGAIAFFQPLKIQHNQGMCCAECVFKKEDEIEIVDQEEEKTEA